MFISYLFHLEQIYLISKLTKKKRLAVIVSPKKNLVWWITLYILSLYTTGSCEFVFFP